MAGKKCPVCGQELKDAGVSVNVGGKQVTVCCSSCAEKAQENPAKFAKAAT